MLKSAYNFFKLSYNEDNILTKIEYSQENKKSDFYFIINFSVLFLAAALVFLVAYLLGNESFFPAVFILLGIWGAFFLITFIPYIKNRKNTITFEKDNITFTISGKETVVSYSSIKSVGFLSNTGTMFIQSMFTSYQKNGEERRKGKNTYYITQDEKINRNDLVSAVNGKMDSDIGVYKNNTFYICDMNCSSTFQKIAEAINYYYPDNSIFKGED